LTIIILPDKLLINLKGKEMKRTIFMTAIALLISTGLSAQNTTRMQTEQQNRSSATVQEQTRGQFQNYGQMTSEQKQARNAERKALKKQQKEMKKEQAQMNQQKNMDRNKAAAKNKGARTSTPMKNAAKVSRGSGPGKK
jgi:membrane protein involved in colicin uptake